MKKDVFYKVDIHFVYLVLDATSKIPSGILRGNIVDLGMYDECISVLGNMGGNEILGKHCMYSFNLPKIPSNVTLSMCIPRSCDTEDLKNILQVMSKNVNETFDFYDWKSDVNVMCSTVEDQKVSSGTIGTL